MSTLHLNEMRLWKCYRLDEMNSICSFQLYFLTTPVDVIKNCEIDCPHSPSYTLASRFQFIRAEEPACREDLADE